MTKPRILIVSTAYLPLVGGAEIAVSEITKRLKERFVFELICARLDPHLPRKETIGAVHVRRVGVGHTADKFLLFFAVIFHLVRAGGRYDLVWTIMASYGALGVFVAGKLRKGPAHLLTLQEGDEEEHILSRVGIFYPLWRAMFKNTDYVQAISRYLASFARRHGARAPVEVVPNGISVSDFRGARVRKNLSSPVVIITTSRLVRKNGVDTLIQAASVLSELLPDTDYVVRIVGGGGERSALENLAGRLGVGGRVVFVGHVAPREVAAELAKGDIFARISRSEGFGNSFVEAMAAGLPIIGTRVGGIPDFLEHKKTGLVAEPDNPQDVAKKIAMFVKDDELRTAVAKRGRELALSRYGWGGIAKKMENIFTALIN